MVDPKDDLRAFLRANLDASAVSVPFASADGVVFADYDGERSYPQVAIVSKDSVVPGGGQTQATGINPADGSPIQDVVYQIQVDCWGGPEDDEVYQEHGSHPDIVANELGEAVADACRVGTDGAPAGYAWLFAEPPTEANDTEEIPTEHREYVIVRMKHTYR
jgi:hypothetical protein